MSLCSKKSQICSRCIGCTTKIKTKSNFISLKKKQTHNSKKKTKQKNPPLVSGKIKIPH